MINLSLAEIAEVLGCAVPEPADMRIHGVCIDSREVRAGNLFAALGGARVDGHQFLDAARDAGAVAALVGKACRSELPELLVSDVQAALGTLARHWRGRFDCTVIGITGSNGKTTTRELVSGILAQCSEVLSTSGNHNNELGLPLTLFQLGEQHRHVVLEMGAARKGDIRYLSSIACQRVALVTNVGPAHLQGFGDEQGVAEAKGEIYQALPDDGIAVINADDPWHRLWASMVGERRMLRFGRDLHCDVSLENRSHQTRINTPSGSFDLNLSLPGDHNIQNALAATAVGVALGIPLDSIQAGLCSVRPVPGRLNLLQGHGGWTVIDDTYNANPASLYAALQVLAHQPGEPWLVLGDMKELGVSSRKLHAEMGEAARALGVKRLFAIGDATEATVDAYGDGGRFLDSHDELIELLTRELHPGVTCLVKGSRSMGMERVVAAIAGPREWRETG